MRDVPIDLEGPDTATLRCRMPETLPRKEVIQPHVPVRLPCYDFVTVTSLTLGTCPACALARRL